MSPPGSLSPVPATALVLPLSNRLAARLIKSLLPPRADAQLNPPCTVGTAGPVPVALGPLEGAELGLITQVKACETLIIEAVLTRDRATAWKAMALHPLVDSIEIAKTILDEYCEAIPEIAAVFEKGE